MDIAYHKYTLSPLLTTNRFKSSKRDGVLFKVNGKHYVDYHPWHEFGDLPVGELLDNIRHTNKLPSYLVENLDLEKRRHEIPIKEFLNHQLIRNGDIIKNSVVKIKYLGNIDELIKFIRDATNIKIRIDFNNGLKIDELVNFWNDLTANEKNKIEYLEDPLVATHDMKPLIGELAIPLAADRNPFNNDIYEFNIYKPNIDTKDKIKNHTIFSSYMGHDLGRYHCFLRLMEDGDTSLYHGIDTPGIYENQIELFQNDFGVCKIDMKAVQIIYDNLKECSWKNLV